MWDRARPFQLFRAHDKKPVGMKFTLEGQSHVASVTEVFVTAAAREKALRVCLAADVMGEPRKRIEVFIDLHDSIRAVRSIRSKLSGRLLELSENRQYARLRARERTAGSPKLELRCMCNERLLQVRRGLRGRTAGLLVA